MAIKKCLNKTLIKHKTDNEEENAGVAKCALYENAHTNEFCLLGNIPFIVGTRGVLSHELKSVPKPLHSHIRRIVCDPSKICWAEYVVCARSLTRAVEGGGGAKNAHPSGFSRIAEKRRRAAPLFFQYLLTIEFDTLCKNFSPRSPKAGHQVRSKSKTGF